MSNARAVLRLLDDLPMLQYTIEYGLGKHVSIYIGMKLQLNDLINVTLHVFYILLLLFYLVEAWF